MAARFAARSKCEILAPSKCRPLRLRTRTLRYAVGTSHLCQLRSSGAPRWHRREGLAADFKSLSSIDARFPYEPNVEANQKEHEVDDAPQSQQFWRNGKPKKRNGQVSNIEIRVYPRANKKRTGEKFTDLFPTNTHNPTFPNELWNGVNDIRRKHFPCVSYGHSRWFGDVRVTSALPLIAAP